MCICILQARTENAPLNRSQLTTLKVPVKREIRLNSVPTGELFGRAKIRHIYITRSQYKIHCALLESTQRVRPITELARAVCGLARLQQKRYVYAWIIPSGKRLRNI